MTGKIETVAIIGAGVIGGSWAALFLAHGYKVVVTDPAPGAEAALHAAIHNAWPSLVEIAAAPAEYPSGNLRFTLDLADAVGTANFIQENGPENLEWKLGLYRQLDELAPSDAIISSSSSGLRIGDIQAACKLHPERTLIGHPFNPPHLLPLVELVGGPKTSSATINAARDFYEGMGKKTILLQKEVLGHVANRLQAALFREVTHLVKEGVVTVEDADAAVRFGPGLRWSVMGQCLLYHLGAGDQGLDKFLDKFAPSINAWWADLGTPMLDEETRALLSDGVRQEAGTRPLSEWAAWRDKLLISRLNNM